jgi:single-strand DNA-binding protein
MNEIYATVQGRVVATPESRITRGGVPFTAFRLASTVRRPNPQTREYEDGPTNFFSVTAFRTLGANVGNSLKKGDPVVVYGRMRVNQWMRSDNIPATSVEIDAYSVGHDLTWGTTELVRVSRAQVDQTDRLADEVVQSAHADLEEALEGGRDRVLVPQDADEDTYVLRDGVAPMGADVSGSDQFGPDGDEGTGEPRLAAV